MLLDSPEKKSVSNTIVPTSAIEEPAITSCPNGVSTCPASFSTANTIPRPVAENITAISRGERTRPAPFKASPQTSPSATDAREAEPGRAEEPASQALVVHLEAGDQQQEGEADEGEHLHRLVRVRPAEHGRAHEDPETELEDDVRQSQARDEISQQGRDEGGCGDDGETRERDRVHAR
jgi:hypothetical protein